jgi:hypothetical protein
VVQDLAAQIALDIGGVLLELLPDRRVDRRSDARRDPFVGHSRDDPPVAPGRTLEQERPVGACRAAEEAEHVRHRCLPGRCPQQQLGHVGHDCQDLVPRRLRVPRRRGSAGVVRRRGPSPGSSTHRVRRYLTARTLLLRSVDPLSRNPRAPGVRGFLKASASRPQPVAAQRGIRARLLRSVAAQRGIRFRGTHARPA